MESIYITSLARPTPTSTKAFSRVTDWSLLSNDDLKFALDLLSLHYSPYEVDAANEIQKRIERGTWLDFDMPVPTNDDEVPGWLHVWPFCLLWSQRPR